MSCCFRWRRECAATFLTAIAFAFSALVGFAGEAPAKKSFDLPAGPAAETLRRFITQSGVQLLYAPDEVAGVRTNAVQGTFTPGEAVDQLVANTALMAVQTSSGAIAINRGPVPNGPRATPVARHANDQPAVELSPFVITESAETGWVATETLAGSRLRTNFKDVPNEIETLTKDFLSDLALTNVEQAMIYTANVEKKTDSPAVGVDSDTKAPTRAGRIRGIGTGTRSRNFFQVTSAPDNFNLERVTVASGPNAILFGMGSPAGIFDVTPARALPRNQYGFELQYDSEDSKRATFDANTVVVPGKVALRLMGLTKREYTDKKPNLDRDDRVYGTATITPFKHTTLILQGERSNRNWNRATSYAPKDFASPWYRANEIPGSGYSVAKPVYNNASLAGIANNRLFAQSADAPVLVSGGSGLLQNFRNSVTVRPPSAMPGVDPQFDAVDFTLLDESILPFDVNIYGTARTNTYAAYTRTAILEQQLAPNLFLELGYNSETAYEQRLANGAGDGIGYNLNVDANQFIAGTNIPNPNLGKLYTQGTSKTHAWVDRREDWRATLSYELDAARKFSDRGTWARWLGRHRFAGLHTVSHADSKNQQNFNRTILDDPVIPGVTLRAKNLQNWATHASRQPQFRYYLNSPSDAPSAAGPMTGDWSLLDTNGRPYSLYLFDTPLTAKDGKRLGAQTVTSGSLNRSIGDIFAWQGFFLPDRDKLDRLVLTLGYRKDTAKSASLDEASTTQDFSGLYPVLWDTNYGAYGETQSGINRNLGIVARPLKWLTAFYNHSTTFDLNTGQYDPFGNEIPGAGGKGQDFGIRFDLWTDKVSLRINRYENTIGPQRSVGSVRGRLASIENRVRELDPAAPTINIVDGNRRGFQSAGAPNYQVMSDAKSTGYEVTLNLTPIPNWNIRVNGSKSEAVETNIGEPWFAWTAQRLPVWQAVVAKNGERDSAGKPLTWKTAPLNAADPAGDTLEQFYNARIVNDEFARMTASDGSATVNARSGRANLITNYQFREGRIKGLNVGGAVRWRAAPVIGYGVSTNASGLRVLDLGRPYYGETELNFDAFLGYRGRMTAFGGFRYRVQLNVRNVLDEHDPVPIQAISTGATSAVVIPEPRVMVFTFAVDF